MTRLLSPTQNLKTLNRVLFITFYFDYFYNQSYSDNDVILITYRMTPITDSINKYESGLDSFFADIHSFHFSF